MSDFWQVKGGERTCLRECQQLKARACFVLGHSHTRLGERARERVTHCQFDSQLALGAVKEEKHIHREPSSPSPPPLANQETPEKKLCLVSKREPGSGSGASTSLSTLRTTSEQVLEAIVPSVVFRNRARE